MAPLITAHAWDYEPEYAISRHRHDKAQLLYACAGVMKVTAQGLEVIVPNTLAVWIPAACPHQVTTRHRLQMRTLYVNEQARIGFPPALRVVRVSPLLREGILALIRYDTPHPSSRVDHLHEVILDELEALEVCPLQLPIPSDPRLLRITRFLDDNPGDTAPLSAFVGLAAASERTLARLFVRETGMTFGQWRRQRRIMHAMELLSAGASVTATAFDVGYQSPSAFIEAFRSILGIAPGRFMAALK